jgi:hypothetical protein
MKRVQSDRDPERAKGSDAESRKAPNRCVLQPLLQS